MPALVPAGALRASIDGSCIPCIVLASDVQLPRGLVPERSLPTVCLLLNETTPNGIDFLVISE